MGGMGIVFEAQQESPQRRVALKILHPLTSTDRARERLRLEAELLGRFQHPNIAQIFESGEADFGRGVQPFFAMEFVDGSDLRSYASRKGLGLRERLKLIAVVGEAVHHAHARGIIHRDLKPENILVDEEGHPKIVDFGIAQAEPNAATLDSFTTEKGEILGTLAYMAPEQLHGNVDSISPKTDIYALGIIGYELISGRLPHDVSGLPISRAIHIITNIVAPKLSAVDRAHRGDVENIIGRATEKEPSRRYVSAAAFAADIRRYLDDLPIVARPQSKIYLLRQYVKRQKRFVGALSAAFMILVAGVVVAAVFAGKERRQRTQAERRAYRSDILAAYNLIQNGETGQVVPVLERASKFTGRGWELDVISSSVHRHQKVFPTPIPLKGFDDKKDENLNTIPSGRIAISEDETLAATLMRDRTVALWDLQQGEVVHRIQLGAPYRALAEDLPDGKLAVATDRGPVEIWQVDSPRSPEIVNRIPLEAEACDYLTYSPDRKRLALAGRHCWLWSEEEGLVQTSDPDQSMLQRYRTPCFMPGGASFMVAVVSHAEEVDCVTKKHRFLMQPAQRLSASRTATTFAASLSRRVRVFRSPKDPTTYEDRAMPEEFVTGLAISGDGSRIAASSADHLKLVDLKSDFEITLYHQALGKGHLDGLRFTPSANRVFAIKDGRLISWDWQSLEFGRVFESGGEYVYDACFSVDASLVAYRAAGRRLEKVPLVISDTRTGSEISRFMPLKFWRPIAFSADSTKLLVDLTRTTATILDLASGESREISRVDSENHRMFLWSDLGRLLNRRRVVQGNRVDQSYCGRWLAFLDEQVLRDPNRWKNRKSWDNLFLLDLKTKERKRFASPAEMRLTTVSLLKNAKSIAFGTKDGRIGILDGRNGNLIAEVRAHSGATFAVNVSPDGSRIASGGEDGICSIWNLDELEDGPLFSHRFSQSYVFTLKWSEDGSRLLATTGDGTVHILDSASRSVRSEEAHRERTREATCQAQLDHLERRCPNRKALARALRHDELPSLDAGDRSVMLGMMTRKMGDIEGVDRPVEWTESLAAARIAIENDWITTISSSLNRVPNDRRGFEWNLLHRWAPRFLMTTFEGGDRAETLLSDGQNLIVRGSSRIGLLDPVKGTIQELFAEEGLVSLSSNSVNSRVAALDTEGRVVLLDVSDPTVIGRTSPMKMDPGTKMWVGSSGERVFCVESLGEGKKRIRTVTFDRETSSSFTLAADRLFFGSSDRGLIALRHLSSELTSFLVVNEADGTILAQRDLKRSRGLAFSPRDGLIVCAPGDTELAFLHPRTLEIQRSVPLEKARKWHHVDISPNGSTIALTAEAGILDVVDADTGTTLRSVEFKQTQARTDVAVFGPGNRWLSLQTSLKDSTFALIELNPKRWITLTRSEPGVTDLAFSPDGSLLASLDREDRAIEFWDPLTKSLLSQIPLPKTTNDPVKIRFEESGAGVLVEDESREEPHLFRFSAQGWRTGSPRRDQGHEETIRPTVAADAAIRAEVSSRDTKRLFVGLENGEIRILESGGRPLLELPAHPRGVVALALSPKEDLLASACSAGEIRLWDTKGQFDRLEEFQAWTGRGHRIEQGTAEPGVRTSAEMLLRSLQGTPDPD